MDTPIHELVHIHAGRATMEGMLDVPDECRGVVLFSHGSGSGRNSPRNNYVASELRRHGLGTLLLDLLSHEEEVQQHNRFDIPLLASRLDAAVDYLRDRRATSAEPIGLFGASTGAAAALQVADIRGPEIAAVVSRGGRPDLAGSLCLGGVRSPTLLIVGSHDDMVLNLNRAAMAAMRGEVELQIIPGATHLFEEPGALEQVAHLACDWFVTHCRGLLPGEMGASQGKPSPGTPRR